MLLKGAEAAGGGGPPGSSVGGRAGGQGAMNGKEERIRESWLQRRNDNTLGSSGMTEPTTRGVDVP